MALEGDFYFNRTPLASPGNTAIINDKPIQQKYWDPYMVEVWCLGTAIEHLICHKVYFNKIQSKSISDTVKLPPEHNKIRGISNKEAATNTALYLIEAIYNLYPTAPFSPIWATKLQAIMRLEYIFKQKSTPREAPHKETTQTKMEVIHKNPPKTTTVSRVKIPSNLITPAPKAPQNPKSHPPHPSPHTKKKSIHHRGW